MSKFIVVLRPSETLLIDCSGLSDKFISDDLFRRLKAFCGFKYAESVCTVLPRVSFCCDEVGKMMEPLGDGNPNASQLYGNPFDTIIGDVFCFSPFFDEMAFLSYADITALFSFLAVDEFQQISVEDVPI